MGARRKQHRQEEPVGNGSMVETTRAPESHPLRKWGGGETPVESSTLMAKSTGFYVLATQTVSI